MRVKISCLFDFHSGLISVHSCVAWRCCGCHRPRAPRSRGLGSSGAVTACYPGGRAPLATKSPRGARRLPGENATFTTAPPPLVSSEKELEKFSGRGGRGEPPAAVRPLWAQECFPLPALPPRPCPVLPECPHESANNLWAHNSTPHASVPAEASGLGRPRLQFPSSLTHGLADKNLISFPTVSALWISSALAPAGEPSVTALGTTRTNPSPFSVVQRAEVGARTELERRASEAGERADPDPEPNGQRGRRGGNWAEPGAKSLQRGESFSL